MTIALLIFILKFKTRFPKAGHDRCSEAMSSQGDKGGAIRLQFKTYTRYSWVVDE